MLILAVFAASGCVTTTQYDDQTRQVAQLQLEVKDLRDQLRVLRMELTRSGDGSQGQLPNIRLELDQMRNDLQKLINSVESVEKRAVTGGRSLTLKEHIEFMGARLDRIEARMGLKPLDVAVVTPPSGAEGTTPPPAGDDSNAITVDTEGTQLDTAAFEDAKNLYKEEQFDEALKKFKAFVSAFPDSGSAPAAQYYVGECLFKKQTYEEAIIEYQNLIDKYPKSPEVPTALLKQGLSFERIGDKSSAKLFYEKVAKQYPKSNAAKTAKEKLKTMR